MIVSVSRRTDIPAFYSDWLINRIKAGYCLVANPYNPKQIKKVSLYPDDVDCFVFWTRNPEAMMKYLDFLDESGFSYYFMITLTNYPEILEPENPDKNRIIDSIINLSEKIGKERVIWRYDPIVLANEITPEFHLANFSDLLNTLSDFVGKIITSVLSNYRKTERRMLKAGYQTIYNYDEIVELLETLNDVAATEQKKMQICCPDEKLKSAGIESASCIDINLINKISKKNIPYKRDRNQRLNCNCNQAVDIGANNTCIHGCRYCYANISRKSALSRYAKHDPKSEFLI